MQQVTAGRLLLVEGRDEEEFFGELLAHLGVSAQVIGVGGAQKFALEFPNLNQLTHGFENQLAYAIIRDADRDKQATFQSVARVLAACGQPVPETPDSWSRGTTPAVGVFILPGGQGAGMLEDLCLRTVADAPAMPCVEQFIQCLREHLPDAPPDRQRRAGRDWFFPKNVRKARAKAFLASVYWDLPSLGVAASKGIWDLDHEALSPLVTFLRGLAR